MPTYVRSVLFRVVGAFAGMFLWVGFIIFFVANFDSTVVSFEDWVGVWMPLWLVTLVITVAVFFVRRRLGPGPGWGAYVIGAVAPFVGLFLNANMDGGGTLWFWLPVLAMVLVPLVTPGSQEAPEGS